MNKEVENIFERYSMRDSKSYQNLYSVLNPSVWKSIHEKQKKLIYFLNHYIDKELEELSVMEVGCGSGNNLLELLRMGFSADKLVGNELLPERFSVARKNLPNAIALYEGDATKLDFRDESFDIVYQSTVFSSILNDEFQAKLAARMWDWVRPGGGVLWYDFTYNNPSNPDVRGVKLSRIRELFPKAKIHTHRVTLAPPISRLVCKIHPELYSILNVLPILRTHLLCWIGKE